MRQRLLALVALSSLLASAAVAQPALVALSPELALARLCVNESGLRAYAYDDCAAIHAVIRFRQEHVPAYRGTSYVEALHRYSNGVVVHRPDRSRPWIADLWPQGHEPAGYCPTCRWAGRGERWWRLTQAHASAVYRGEVADRCSQEPHTWARRDVAPADSRAQALSCGLTINTFWSIPHYAARWPETPTERWTAPRPGS